jgi:hypothetical protein
MWYKHMLDTNNTFDESHVSLLSANQLMSIMFQLRKVVNHPKQILLKRERERKIEAARVESAGEQF